MCSTREHVVPTTALSSDGDHPKARRYVANADSVTTIPKSALVEYAGVLAPDTLAELDDALRFALGLDARSS